MKAGSARTLPIPNGMGHLSSQPRHLRYGPAPTADSAFHTMRQNQTGLREHEKTAPANRGEKVWTDRDQAIMASISRSFPATAEPSSVSSTTSEIPFRRRMTSPASARKAIFWGMVALLPTAE